MGLINQLSCPRGECRFQLRVGLLTRRREKYLPSLSAFPQLALSGYCRSDIPTYSGGTALDSHQLPCYAQRHPKFAHYEYMHEGNFVKYRIAEGCN